MSAWSPEALALSAELAESLGQSTPQLDRHRRTKEKEQMSVVQPGAGADAPEIDDGLYLATVKSVKDLDLEQPDQFGNKEKVEIEVTFEDNHGEDQTLNPRVNRKWGEKANLFLIAIACGIDANPMEAFDTERLVGRQVNVLVETQEEGKWPRIKSWGRVKEKSGTRASVRATEPSVALANTPAMITATGELNWTVFWRAIDAAGVP